MTTAENVPRQAERRPTPPEPERKPLDLMRFVTSIGSPIALATSLLLYFGWVRSEEQAREFGADASVFAMSTQDYVLRSVNILFFPILLLLLIALLALRLDARLRDPAVGTARLATLSKVLRWSWAFFLPLAIVLYAVARPVGDATLPLWVLLSILGPVYGTILHRAAVGDTGRFSPIAVGVLAALVTVALFWQTERLASVGGRALAQDLKDNLADRLTRVELFSAKDLLIAGPGVTSQHLGGSDSAYAYEYSGLYLLQRSGDKYFLLTQGWDENKGKLIVLPDSPTIRVEFGH
jgi:hypothetical protein